MAYLEKIFHKQKFLKYHLNIFEYSYKEEYYCIKLTNKYQSGQYQYPIFQNFILPYTTTYETAKYFTKKVIEYPNCVKLYFAQIIYLNLENRNELKRYDAIENILNFCPGYIKTNYFLINFNFIGSISLP